MYLGAGKKLGSSLLAAGRTKCLHQHCSVFSDHVPLLSLLRSVSGFRLLSTTTNSDEGITDDTQLEVKKRDARRKKLRGSDKFHKKLHSRVFSDVEQAENEKFVQSVHLDLEENDMFGAMPKREKNQTFISPSTFNEKENSFPTTKQFPWNHKKDKRHADRISSFVNDDAVSDTDDRYFATRRNEIDNRWGDTFGTFQQDDMEDRIQESLSTTVGTHGERFSDDEMEDRKHIRLSAYNRRRIPEWYGRKILKLGKKGQVKDAIKVLEEWMLKEDRVMPNSYVFTCLITVLGRAGYTNKAFSLFNKMKKMGIHPKPATYTALFNACANSPWKQDGRARADNLYHLMQEQGVEPTFVTGKAMIKAFAVCGDARRAFSLVDELSQMYRPDPEVFSFLLMACISDKHAGLCHAIQVWRLMQQMGVRPDLPLYNLLIRCVRDCGVGDVASFTSMLTGGKALPEQNYGGERQFFQKSSPKTRVSVITLKGSQLEQGEKEGVCVHPLSSVSGDTSSPKTEELSTGVNKALPDSEAYYSYGGTDVSESGLQQETHNSLSSTSLTLQSPPAIPDVLSLTSDISQLVSLGNLSTKESRLLLLGGVDGVLSRMDKDGATPDIITFTQLISVAIPTVEEEVQLLERMKSKKLKPDIDLVNTLIHKRCMRRDFAAAKEAAKLMQDHGLTPNQRTYGVLAMTCKTIKDATRLLEDMEAADMAPNMEIMGTLMYSAHLNFAYKLWVLRQTQKLDLLPNNKFLHNVEDSIALARRRMVEAEKHEDHDSYFLSAKFQDSLETFVKQYEAWLKQTRVQIPPHPWAALKPAQEDEKHAVSK